VSLHSDFCDVLPSDFHLNVEIVDVEPSGKINLRHEAEKITEIKIPYEELDRRFFGQNLPKNRIPLKVSVSELSHDENAAQM